MASYALISEIYQPYPEILVERIYPEERAEKWAKTNDEHRARIRENQREMKEGYLSYEKYLYLTREPDWGSPYADRVPWNDENVLQKGKRFFVYYDAFF